MSTRTDAYHGRKGGNWLPDNFQAIDHKKAPRCELCGQRMLVGQRGRHYVCTPESIVAKKCTCRPGCTVDLVGDGPTPCNPDCDPCRLKRNVKHKEVVEWQ